MLSNAILSAIAAFIAHSKFAEAAALGKGAGSMPEDSLTTRLRLADSVVDRYGLLPEDKDFVYDFNSSETGFADSKSFPALVGTGLSFASAPLPGCHMVMVHLHPRSAELFAVVSGRIYTEGTAEAGVVDSQGKPRVIKTELSAGQATVFYQGTMHYQINPDCEPAQAVAAFSSEDAGTSAAAASLLSLGDEAVSRAFGQSIAGEDVDKIRHSIPATAAVKVDECLAKCGKQKRRA
ncbi:hypothetical protein F66182_2520 [Fusarium sp. NRRL 66182]|nr:hypothetical protein F66182_2520 [Fusarium sp. NRRL 66182]